MLMKKILLTVTLIILVSAGLPAREKEKERRLTLQTSPIFLLTDLFVFAVSDEFSFFIMDLEGQYKINNIFNVSLTSAFFVFNNPDNLEGGNGFQFILKPMFIYRPFRTGLEGFYLGLYSNVGWQSENSSDEKDSWIEIGFGIGTGYKWVFRNGFTLQLGTGMGKTWTLSDRDSYSIFSSDGRIAMPNLDIQIIGLKLGYSF